MHAVQMSSNSGFGDFGDLGPERCCSQDLAISGERNLLELYHQLTIDMAL